MVVTYLLNFFDLTQQSVPFMDDYWGGEISNVLGLRRVPWNSSSPRPP